MANVNDPVDEAEKQERWRIYVESGLSVADPTAVPGLLRRVSRDAVPSGAIDYNTRLTLGRKVDCAACGHSRNHFKGFLVTFEGGTRALVGIECGERDFFAEGAWGRLRSRLEQEKKSALYAARQAPVLRALRDVKIQLSEWANSAEQLTRFVAEFEEAFPDLALGLADSARAGGNLTRSTMRNTPYRTAGGEIVDRMVAVEETVVKFPCPEVFSVSISSRLRAILLQIRAIEGVVEREDASQPKLAAAYTELRKLRTNVQDLHDVYGRARSFVDVGLWDLVAKWGRADPSRVGNYRRSGMRFRHSDEDYDYGEVRLLKPEDIPAVPLKPILDRWPSL